MLIRNSYQGCSRLYWELEDLEREAPEATFVFKGKLHHLEFDGCVDQLIQDNLKDIVTPSAIDIAELYEVVPMLDAASDKLAAGRKVKLKLSTGQVWEAVERTSRLGKSIVMRSGFGQTATLSRDEDNCVNRLILRTEGCGITHEIKAEPGFWGRLEAIAEAVTVFY